MSAISELRLIRTESGFSGDPETVLHLARPLIQSGQIASAGDEAWDIYEQTLIAAVETSEDSLALTCLTRLSDKFPQSGRVHALRGMLLETTQDTQETLKFYNKVLDVEPTNVPIQKRKIAFVKSIGRFDEAISLLIAYLDVYYTDPDAWAELADIYTNLGQFEKAAFCWSEVVLLKPHDHVVQADYADTLLAQYLQESELVLLHTAAKTYLRSIELCDAYVRSFCGLKVCCNKLLSNDAQTKNRIQNQRGEATPLASKALLSAQSIKALDIMTTNFLSSLQGSAKLEPGSEVSQYVAKLVNITQTLR